MSLSDTAYTEDPFPPRPGIRSHFEREPCWYALRTVPQRELLAARMITKRFGYVCFCAVEYKWRREAHHRKRRKRVAIPMFRGYIFVQLPHDVNWQELLEAEVASKEIPTDLIERLRGDEKTKTDIKRLKRLVPTVDCVRIIQNVVRFEDGKPAPIDEDDMQMLFRLQGQSIPNTLSVNTHKSVTIGDKAVITSGPFLGHHVTIEGIDKGKAQVFLSLFGSMREIAVPIEQMEAA